MREKGKTLTPVAEPVKILYIEDNPGDAKLMAKMLNESIQPFVISQCDSLEKGLDRLSAEGPDLVLLDLNLPDSHGLDTLDSIRHAAPLVPVVILTGLDDEAMWLEAVKHGAQDYQVKGQVNASLLLRSIRYAIDRRRAEADLRRSEAGFRSISAEFHALLDAMPDNLSLLDRDRKVLWTNRSTEEYLKKNAHELAGMPCYSLWRCGDPAGRSCPVLKTFETGHPQSETITTVDDKIWEVRTAPIRDQVGVVVSVVEVLRDVSEHRQLENQLRHAQKMEAVGTLAGGIAHDFNNILNVIIGYGTMVMDRMETGSQSREQMVEVLAAAERASTLTRRLLAFSRKTVVEVKPLNLNELVLGLQKMLLRMLRENIDLELNLADRALVVMADAGQLEQVLLNLASNAQDAMPQSGQLTISTGLEDITEDYVAAHNFGMPGRYARITVTDTGHGMDSATQEKIFEPFFTTKGIGAGTGLGLSISYGIIKQHNGYINVYSEKEQGTVFKIYLPLIEDTLLPGGTTGEKLSIKGGNETILVAEDDASLMRLTRSVLEAYGYSVLTATDGEDAILKFSENRERIDLVILDMIMPRRSGRDASEKIRTLKPGIKTLFLSGYTMDLINTREIIEAGFDFIHKPVSPKDFLIKVREILDR